MNFTRAAAAIGCAALLVACEDVQQEGERKHRATLEPAYAVCRAAIANMDTFPDGSSVWPAFDVVEIDEAGHDVNFSGSVTTETGVQPFFCYLDSDDGENWTVLELRLTEPAP